MAFTFINENDVIYARDLLDVASVFTSYCRSPNSPCRESSWTLRGAATPSVVFAVTQGLRRTNSGFGADVRGTAGGRPYHNKYSGGYGYNDFEGYGQNRSASRGSNSYYGNGASDRGMQFNPQMIFGMWKQKQQDSYYGNNYYSGAAGDREDERTQESEYPTRNGYGQSAQNSISQMQQKNPYMTSNSNEQARFQGGSAQPAGQSGAYLDYYSQQALDKGGKSYQDPIQDYKFEYISFLDSKGEAQKDVQHNVQPHSPRPLASEDKVGDASLNQDKQEPKSIQAEVQHANHSAQELVHPVQPQVQTTGLSQPYQDKAYSGDDHQTYIKSYEALQSQKPPPHQAMPSAVQNRDPVSQNRIFAPASASTAPFQPQAPHKIEPSPAEATAQARADSRYYQPTGDSWQTHQKPGFSHQAESHQPRDRDPHDFHQQHSTNGRAHDANRLPGDQCR